MTDPLEEFRTAIAPEPETPPAPEPPSQPAEPPAPEPTPTPPQPGPEDQIPSWRLREESERARKAEEHVKMLDARLREIEGHVRQRAPEGAKAPDIWEDPQGAVESMLIEALGPFVQNTQRTLMHIGRMSANQAHTKEVVDKAEKAFMDAVESRSVDPFEYEQVVQSPNRYDACVEWHKRRSVLADVGNDPSAWFEKELAKRLSDEGFKAKIVETLRTGSASPTPSVTRLPPSLVRGPSAVAPAADGAVGDMSDASLFEFARK